jgi:hypothetical protein
VSGLQQLAGMCLLLMGLVAFLDRDRPTQARSDYYWYDVRVGTVGRSVGSLVAISIGAVLLLTG